MIANLPEGRRFYAYNADANLIVFWLGNAESEAEMKRRIEEYGAPAHVVPQSFTRGEAMHKLRVEEKRQRREDDRLLREELEATAGKPVPGYDGKTYRFT